MVGSSVSWSDWTAGDGITDASDADGISFIKTLIQKYISKYPDPSDRVGVFWAGGLADTSSMSFRVDLDRSHSMEEVS